MTMNKKHIKQPNITKNWLMQKHLIKHIFNMRKYIFFTLVLLLVTMTAQAQRTVSGRVTTATNNEPLSDANIQVKGTLVGTTTDADGRYSIYVPSGSNTLVFNFTGFVSQEIPIGNKSVINVQLNEGVELENVMVIGSRNATRTKLETPVPVDVIPISVVVNEVGQVDLNQILNYLAPAFQSNRQTIADGTDHIDPAQLRGLGTDQVLVLVNGKRRHTSALINVNGTVGRGSVSTDLSTIPVAAIERIEVLRDGASAQYGSDAIAGVINVVLKKNTDMLNANVTSGILQAGDGTTTDVGINYGFQLLEKGYINVSAQYTDRGATNRMKAYTGPIFNTTGSEDAYINERVAALGGRTRQQADDDTLRTMGIERSAFNMQIGNSAIRSGGAFFNLSYPLSNNAELYAFGGYNNKKGRAGGFYRLPNDARNNKSIYPLGFLPEIHSTINDQSLTLGVKGTLRGWNVDFSSTMGSNSFLYRVENSLNASMGLNTPSSFNAGGLFFGQNTLNFDMNKLYGAVMSGLNIALGAEYRADRFRIEAGEEASYRNYGLINITDTARDASGRLIYTQRTIDQLGKTGGSQVFPGFRPENEGDNTRTNAAFYADVELDVSEKFLIEAAGRYEFYSDFGSTLNVKLASRYKISDNIAVRGAFSTGFRAPSQQQKYFNNTATLFVGGIPREVGTFSNNSRIAQEFGILPLTQERSQNFSIGLTARPMKNLEATLDIYSVYIKNRISLTGQFSSTSPEIATILRNANASAAGFFTNAVDTRSSGVDLVLTYRTKWNEGDLSASVAGTMMRNEVIKRDDGSDKPEVNASAKIKSDPIALNTYFNREDQSRLEVAIPNNKFVVTLNYKKGKWGVMLRNVYFGSVKYVDPIDINDTLTWLPSYRVAATGSFRNADGTLNTAPFKNAFSGTPESFDQTFGGRIVTDFSLSYQFNSAITLTLGANNLLNVYPDKHTHSFNQSFGRFDYSRRVQQFGFNGAYYFGRLIFVLR